MASHRKSSSGDAPRDPHAPAAAASSAEFCDMPELFLSGQSGASLADRGQHAAGNKQVRVRIGWWYAIRQLVLVCTVLNNSYHVQCRTVVRFCANRLHCALGTTVSISCVYTLKFTLILR